MSAYLDIIGGTIIGGMMLIMALGASEFGTRQMYNYNAEEILQSNITRMARVIDYDLGKMGFAVPEMMLSKTVHVKDSDRLKYLAQLNMTSDTYYAETGAGSYDSVVDTIEYRIQNGVTITIADSTIQLYNIHRTIKISDGPSKTMIIGTIGNNDVFKYFDQVGNVAFTPQEVRIIEVNLTALNPDVMLTPELVSVEINNINNAEFRRQELRRVLRTAFWSTRRQTARNMRR